MIVPCLYKTHPNYVCPLEKALLAEWGGHLVDGAGVWSMPVERWWSAGRA